MTMNFKINTSSARIFALPLLLGVAMATGCAHQPPTIAHTHIGHAITAFSGAPEDDGLFNVAEDRAREAQNLARDIQANPSIAEANVSARELIDVIGTESYYGLKFSLREAVSHINYAAGADDASANVRASAAQFATASEDVVRRCDLIMLLASDFIASQNADERQQLGAQISNLATLNVNGQMGSEQQIGTSELREMLDAMVAGEEPPYATVDRWYLFHLVRLPDCDTCWAWRKWANSSNRGY